MTVVKPFKAYKYNEEKVKTNDVITQPYDKISSALWDEYDKKSPYSIAHLILNKELTDDNDKNNKYTRAACLLDSWIDQNIIVQNTQPAVYVYDQVYKIGNTTKRRKGITCLVKLQDFDSGGVKPHEFTLAKPKADRFKLLSETKSLFGHIFMLYPDKKCLIEKASDGLRDHSPDIEGNDEDGNIHQMWEITDESIISAIAETMTDKALLIADGHHRYETYLDYRKALKDAGKDISEDSDCNYAMVTLVNTYDEGLTVLPTHRLVANVATSLDSLLEALKKDFSIKELTIDQADELPAIQEEMEAIGEQNIVFGLYGGGKKIYLLTYTASCLPEDSLSKTRSEAWRSLDLAVLHNHILDVELGIDEEALRQESNITYHRNPAKAFNSVKSGEANFLFLVNPTKVQAVVDVAAAGERMPQKSTDFYPKLMTGMVFYRMEE